MDPAISFRERLQQARCGSIVAFQDLVEACRTDLDNVAHRRFISVDAAMSASDLLQDVWLRVWQRLDQFQDAGDSDEETRRRFIGWACRVLESVELNRRRDAGRQKRQPDTGVRRFGNGANDSHVPATADEVAARTETPSVIVGSREEAKRVREALLSLDDPLTREILILRFLDDQSLRCVSAKLAVPYHEVRQRFRDGMKKLTELLGW